MRDGGFIYSDEPGYADAQAKVLGSGGPGAMFFKPGDPINRQAVGLPRTDKGNPDYKEGDHAKNQITPNGTQRAYLDIIFGRTPGDVTQAYQAIYASLGFPGADGSSGTPANVAYGQLVAGYVAG